MGFIFSTPAILAASGLMRPPFFKYSTVSSKISVLSRDTLLRQAEDALTARELIKGKVLETAPFTSREAAEQVAGAVLAEVVQVIGRTFVLYRRNPKEPKIELPKG